MTTYTMKLHDVGEGVAEAEIIEWRVQVGDAVTADDVVAEVMSDKATIELYSPVDGTVSWRAGEVGDVIAVGSELLKFDTDQPGETDQPEQTGETGETEDAGGPALAPAQPPSGTPAPRPAQAPKSSVGSSSVGSSHVLAAPAVRARARAMAIDLTTVSGTGPEGRIVHADLDAVLAAAAPDATRSRHGTVADGPIESTEQATGEPTRDDIAEIKITGLRRNIAERMKAAKRRIPHFTYVEEVDVTELERLRRQLNEVAQDARPKLTILPFLMRALVVAVRDHPEVNARFDDEAGVVHQHRAVHLGIATQTPRGLMVPVVKSAGALDLWASANEVARLSESARSGKVKLDELTGSTITITSLGALGGIVSTPVINAPEVAIIGVNKIVTRPVYIDGALMPRQIMNLSSSFDHRIIDGVNAATFIQDIKRLLETPALLWTR